MLSSSIFQGVNDTFACVSFKCIHRIDILSKPTVSVIYYHDYCNAHGPLCGQGYSVLETKHI